MASIITYNCSNPECTLSVSLRVNFPIWRNFGVSRKLPVSRLGKLFVKGYKSQVVCWECHKIVDVKDGTNLCPDCGTGEKLMSEGKPCLKCHNGIVMVDKDALTVSF